MTKLKTKEVYTGIYKTVVLISTCEKIIINHYNENEMKTLCICHLVIKLCCRCSRVFKK